MKKLSFLFAALSIMLISNLQAANVQLTVKLKNGDVVTGKKQHCPKFQLLQHMERSRFQLKR
jgi:hypothetical protein